MSRRVPGGGSSSFIPRSSPHPIYLSSPAFNFHCHVIPWPLFKLASSPLGLQVPVLFKLFEPRSYGTSRGSCPCPRLCSVACPRGGHLASRLASTVRRFGAWTSPISTVILTSRQVGGNPRMVGVPPDSLTIALITVSAGWVRDCRAQPGNRRSNECQTKPSPSQTRNGTLAWLAASGDPEHSLKVN